MKTIKVHFNLYALFFSVLILFQSCTVYKSTPVTLGEAVKADAKVKIEKRNGEKLKYFKIVQGNDGKYYGHKKIRSEGTYDNILINEDEVEKIHIKDKTTSTILTIGIIVGYVIGGYALAIDNISFY